jgi:hypothetical protein
MTKIYDDLEARQKKIQELKTTIYIIENDIKNYHKGRGCGFYMSMFYIEKEFIREKNIMLKWKQQELLELQRFIE